MERKYGTARVVFRQGDQTWRVLVGLQPTLESANALAQQLDKEAGPAFVVLVDSDYYRFCYALGFRDCESLFKAITAQSSFRSTENTRKHFSRPCI